MAEPKATPGKPSTPPEPSRNDGRNDAPCVLCAEPIRDQEASRMHLASSPGDRTGSAHAKCIHERAIMGRVMRLTASD